MRRPLRFLSRYVAVSLIILVSSFCEQLLNAQSADELPTPPHNKDLLTRVDVPDGVDAVASQELPLGVQISRYRNITDDLIQIKRRPRKPTPWLFPSDDITIHPQPPMPIITGSAGNRSDTSKSIEPIGVDPAEATERAADQEKKNEASNSAASSSNAFKNEPRQSAGIRHQAIRSTPKSKERPDVLSEEADRELDRQATDELKVTPDSNETASNSRRFGATIATGIEHTNQYDEPLTETQPSDTQASSETKKPDWLEITRLLLELNDEAPVSDSQVPGTPSSETPVPLDAATAEVRGTEGVLESDTDLALESYALDSDAQSVASVDNDTSSGPLPAADTQTQTATVDSVAADSDIRDLLADVGMQDSPSTAEQPSIDAAEEQNRRRLIEEDLNWTEGHAGEQPNATSDHLQPWVPREFTQRRAASTSKPKQVSFSGDLDTEAGERLEPKQLTWAYLESKLPTRLRELVPSIPMWMFFVPMVLLLLWLFWPWADEEEDDGVEEAKRRMEERAERDRIKEARADEARARAKAARDKAREKQRAKQLEMESAAQQATTRQSSRPAEQNEAALPLASTSQLDTSSVDPTTTNNLAPVDQQESGLSSPNSAGRAIADAVATAMSTKLETLGTSDDFTRLDGIDGVVQQALYDAGYQRYVDLQKADPAHLQYIVSNFGDASEVNANEWPRQAAFASRGDWTGLEEYLRITNSVAR